MLLANEHLMQFRYPKSFFKLLFVAFIVAVLPLLAGLLADTVAIQRLSERSQRAVYDAARIVHVGRELDEGALALERSAQQSVLLRDKGLWNGYLALRARFLTAGSELSRMALAADTRQMLEHLMSHEAAIHDQLALAGFASASAPAVARRYEEVSQRATAFLRHSNSLVDREAESLQALASETESRVTGQLFVLIPLSIFVVAGFTHLLSKPIRQLNLAIRGLGEKRLDQPIQVVGPEDLEKLGDQLEWLRLRLIHLEQQKSQFLRHVSHELKTPLTALREGSELLSEEVAGTLTPKQREIALILRQNSLDLQELIETLLRHGEEEFRLAPVRLSPQRPADAITAVLERQKLAAEAKGVRLDLQMQDFVLHTDGERLRVVLDNLVSNAIKYSPPGGCITLRARAADGNAVFEVIDEGPGVPAAEADRIFDPFVRGSVYSDGMVKGTGLGLSIARDHLLALGGDIAVAPGRGHFTVRLPLGSP